MCVCVSTLVCVCVCVCVCECGKERELESEIEHVFSTFEGLYPFVLHTRTLVLFVTFRHPSMLTLFQYGKVRVLSFELYANTWKLRPVCVRACVCVFVHVCVCL